jgi:uncharacterized protein (TIGR03086 family)
MTDLAILNARGLDDFGNLVRQVRDDQWHAPTPCPDWDVRALVNHVTVEQLWAPDVIGGRTVEQVGDKYAGDQLGTDPVAAWTAAAAAARTAFSAKDALLGRVHLSYGDAAASHYCGEMTVDLVVHAWDLARAIGADERRDSELVGYALEQGEARGDQSATGFFDAPVAVSPDADQLTRMLALYGRSA